MGGLGRRIGLLFFNLIPMTNRNKKALRVIEDLRRVMDGLKNHPDALQDIKHHPRIPSLNKWENLFMDYEKRREKGQGLISEANEKEEDLIQEIESELNHLRDQLRGKYSNQPEILEDFFGRG